MTDVNGKHIGIGTDVTFHDPEGEISTFEIFTVTGIWGDEVRIENRGWTITTEAKYLRAQPKGGYTPKNWSIWG